MNREELHDAIFELADTQHMLEYALTTALRELDYKQLGDVFDQVADHHSLLTDHVRPLVGLAAEESDQSINSCELVEVDGTVIRLAGVTEIIDETRAALADVVRAAKRRHEQG